MSRHQRSRNRSLKQSDLLTKAADFRELCDHIARQQLVAFDTEFVAESSYRPQLCLLQFATPERIVAVDPFEVGSLTPWWDIMADESTTVVVHGGREEVRFCLVESRQPPRKLVDVQIAEGLQSRGFPLGYSQLVRRVLNRRVQGKQTRTDWSRRPLAEDQVRYALEDVEHLLDIWKVQAEALESQGRLEWAWTEFERFVDDLERLPLQGDWRRLSGIHRLSRRELAIVRELYEWRDSVAEQKNRLVRRVLRDDLLVEVAKLQPKSAQQLQRVRGMERRDYRTHWDEMLLAVQRGCQVPNEELPEKIERNSRSSETEALEKLLAIALANRCAELAISTSLVGTMADLRDLIRWHVFDQEQGPPPKLMQGWREEVCGDVLRDLIDGRTAMRVVDPRSDHPLRFDAVDPSLLER